MVAIASAYHDSRLGFRIKISCSLFLSFSFSDSLHLLGIGVVTRQIKVVKVVVRLQVRVRLKAALLVGLEFVEGETAFALGRQLAQRALLLQHFSTHFIYTLIILAVS